MLKAFVVSMLLGATYTDQKMILEGSVLNFKNNFREHHELKHPRYKVRKKESVDFEIRGVSPWWFE